MVKYKLALLLLLSWIAFQANAQRVYTVDTQYPVHEMQSHLELVKDESNSLTPEQILHDSTLTFFVQPVEMRYLRIGAVYWGRMALMTVDSLKGWTLNFEDRRKGLPAWSRSNGKVDIYGFSEDKLIFHKKAGVEYPISEREVKDKWILNRIYLNDLPINTPIKLIIRVEGNSLGYPSYFNATLRGPGQSYYHELFAFNESFNVFMLGLTFIIFLYHLVEYIYLRQRIFMWFAVWVLFCTLTMAMSVGFIIGDFHNYRLPIWMIIANGVLYSFWFFGRSFINSKEKYPKLDKVILWLSFLMFTEIVIMACYVLIFEPQPFVTGVGIHYKMIIFYSSISIIISLILILKKDLLARYFGVGAITVSLAFLIGALWSEGIIRPPFDPFAWGMFLQVVIYSFGIAYRQRKLLLKSQEEKIEAQMNITEIKQMKDLDEIKTRFFTNLSHEFRTPLSLISGPLNLAKKSNTNESDGINISEKTYNLIEKNTMRLQNLIDQLLEISKMESGKVVLKLSKGELIQFIKSIAFSFESMAESRGVSFNTSFPAELDNAFYDKDQLEKIISNLLTNAFKYTPNGKAVTLSVDYSSTHFTIEISDTGKGISKEEVKHIFERFYRVEGNEAKGSGIGLALTKELVNAHNGLVSVSSKKGEGTSFKVRLPYALNLLPEYIFIDKTNGPLGKNIKLEENLNLNLNELPEQKNGSTKPSPETKMNSLPLVLLVEDNADLRQHISDILDGHYRVLTAEDGLKGERMAIEHIPDIILSDIMMPKKDGYQLCHDLKVNLKTSHIPIIMLTAKAGQDNKMEGLNQGADGYLTKPFRPDELLIRVKNLISSKIKLWEHFNASDLVIVKDLSVISIDDKFLQTVVKFIRSNLDNELLSVDDLAKEVGFSRAQLYRKLKALCNKSAGQLLLEIRLNEAKRMLENGEGNVSEVAYSVGYSNMSYFTKSFKEKFGILPSKVSYID